VLLQWGHFWGVSPQHSNIVLTISRRGIPTEKLTSKIVITMLQNISSPLIFIHLNYTSGGEIVNLDMFPHGWYTLSIMRKIVSKISYTCDFCNRPEEVVDQKYLPHKDAIAMAGEDVNLPRGWQIIKMKHDKLSKHLCDKCIKHLYNLWRQKWVHCNPVIMAAGVGILRWELGLRLIFGLVVRVASIPEYFRWVSRFGKDWVDAAGEVFAYPFCLVRIFDESFQRNF